MFYKYLLEEGEYFDTETGERRNVIFGLEIITPDGEVTQENPQDWIWFDTEEEALEFFGVKKIIKSENIYTNY